LSLEYSEPRLKIEQAVRYLIQNDPIRIFWMNMVYFIFR
jgi:hypothetical protein